MISGECAVVVRAKKKYVRLIGRVVVRETGEEGEHGECVRLIGIARVRYFGRAVTGPSMRKYVRLIGSRSGRDRDMAWSRIRSPMRQADSRRMYARDIVSGLKGIPVVGKDDRPINEELLVVGDQHQDGNRPAKGTWRRSSARCRLMFEGVDRKLDSSRSS